jgi:methylenetetrahydrofolate--tRNA-(uracil-5-)-methyltransferase
MVGFQTRLTWGEQLRIFRTIPGLGQAEFLRHGAIHRNTFLNAPRLLDAEMRLRSEPGVYFAGQITGSEGYVEGAASGWLAAWFIARRVEGHEAAPPPPTTAHGGLLLQLRRDAQSYQPSNVTFSHLAPWEGPRLQKRAKYEAMAARALEDLRGWMIQHGRAPQLPQDTVMAVPGLSPAHVEPTAPLASGSALPM